MILKPFKEKSNQKYIASLISKRQNKVNNMPVKTVGFLFNESEFADFDMVKKYVSNLNINNAHCSILVFTNEKQLEDKDVNTYCNKKDFGWKGNLHNKILKDFINKEFDLLVSYYKHNTTELNLLTALSKANLKVGISEHNQHLYDLVIDVKSNNFDTFKTELSKYLNILNKI